MGGVLAKPGVSPAGVVITAASVGYLRSVDMAALNHVAERLGGPAAADEDAAAR